MQSKLLADDTAGRTFVLVFDPDEEVATGLLKFAKDHELTAARFTAIGAFRQVTLGWFDLDKQDYAEIPLDEQVEVLSLIGNVAVHDEKPKVHAHVVVGLRDGTTRGGHLLEARVRPTLEVMLVETPSHLRRKIDEATGLPLLEPDESALPQRQGRPIEAGNRTS